MQALPSSFDTARLHLRLPRASDAAEIFSAYAQDPEVTRFMIWRPHAHVGETEGFISECISSTRTGEGPIDPGAVVQPVYAKGEFARIRRAVLEALA